MHFVYVLKSIEFKWVYIGTTADLQARLKRHNSGQVKSTKFYKPFLLAHTETYNSKNEASKRELELKHNSFKKKELLILLGLV